MPKYQIQGLISADAPLGEVEADNAKAAIEKAYAELDTSAPSICHQCSHEMNVGDIYSLIASNVDDVNDTLEENDPYEAVRKLRDQIKALGHEPVA